MNVGVSSMMAASAAVLAVGGLRRMPRHVDWARLGIERFAVGRALALSLRRSGSPLGADAFVAAVVGGAVVAAVIVWWLIGAAVAAALVALAIVAGAVVFVRSADDRYVRRLAAQIPVVAQQLAGGLGAGLSLRQAIERAQREIAEPAAGEFKWLAAQLRLGARMDDALQEFLGRAREPGTQLLVTAIVIQRTVGGNLAHALVRLADQLDERERLVREIHSATAQARMSAWLVAALPALGGVAVELAAPGTLQRTLGQGIGRAVLVAAVALEYCGVVLVRRLVAGLAAGVSCRVR